MISKSDDFHRKAAAKMEIKKERNHFAVTLPTESWYGGDGANHLFNRRKFWFPKSWDIEVFAPDGIEDMRPLNERQIRQGIQNPIASEPLRRIAENKRDAAIIVDDLTRPTPAFAVMPAILEELKAGGIKEENIKIVIGLGTHRPLKKFEQRRKLGREVVDRIEVVNHDAFTTRIKRYKRPGGGPDIGIHSAVGEAELKIAVGGITPHGGAGFGGGAKAIVPAVSDYETICFNHAYEWERYGKIYPEKIQTHCIRKDMEEVAQIVGLDFIVNLVVTPCKEVVGVFSGDFIKAHREGCILAKNGYLTDTPKEKLDVIVANSYPFDTDIGQSHRGSWPEKFGHAGVLLGGARDGWAYHGDNGKSYRVYRRMRREQQRLEGHQFTGTKRPEIENDLYYYSRVLTPSVFYERNVNRRFFSEWDELIDELHARRKRGKIGIFPCASMQLEKVD